MATPTKARARLRVVLADDQPMILRMIRMILGEHARLELESTARLDVVQRQSLLAADGAQALPDMHVIHVVTTAPHDEKYEPQVGTTMARISSHVEPRDAPPRGAFSSVPRLSGTRRAPPRSPAPR